MAAGNLFAGVDNLIVENSIREKHSYANCSVDELITEALKHYHYGHLQTAFEALIYLPDESLADMAHIGLAQWSTLHTFLPYHLAQGYWVERNRIIVLCNNIIKDAKKLFR